MNIQKFRTNPEERQWKGDFTFVQGADCQFGLIDRLKGEKAIKWDEELKLSEAAVQYVNGLRPKPKFFVICGDMLDAFPFKGKEREMRKEQLVDFRRVFGKIDPEIPLICVCGNHDVGDIPTKETVRIYREQFGEDYFVFWAGGVRFVVLNSQYYMNADDVKEELEKQNAMIDSLVLNCNPTSKNRAWAFLRSIFGRQRKLEPNVTYVGDDERHKPIHTVVFQHIPYFLYDPEEESSWNSQIPKEKRMPILEKLREAGVRYVFAGHYHRNAGGSYKEIEEVITGPIGAPLGKDPSGIRIVSVTINSISSNYVPITGI